MQYTVVWLFVVSLGNIFYNDPSSVGLEIGEA